MNSYTPNKGSRGSATKKKTTGKKVAGKKSTKKQVPPPESTRNLSAIVQDNQITSDSISVTSRFDGNSRSIALGLHGTAWTGESDGSITVRMAPLGYEIGKIDAFGRSTPLVLLKAKGKMWAGYSDGAIRAFHLDNMKMLFETTKHTSAVHALVEAGGYIYTGGADWKVYQWDAEDYHYERMLTGHSNSVRCLVSYKDAQTGAVRVASGSDDGTMRVWDPAAPSQSACIAILDTEKSVLSALAMEDTAELWTGGDDGVIRVWDLFSMSCTMAVQAQRAPIVTMRQVEDTVWTGAKNGTMVILNRMTKSVAHQTSQPPSAAGAGRFTMALMPVQRTLVHNVWATTSDGQWQCWSCIYPESGALGDEEVAVPMQVSRRSRRSSSLPHTPKQKHRPAPAAEPLDEAEQSRVLEQTEKDRELRQSVARCRRSVVESINESSALLEQSAADAAAAAAEDEDDGDVPLYKLEKSIRRDHDEDVDSRVTAERERSERLHRELNSARRHEVEAAGPKGAAAVRARQDLEDQLREAIAERDLYRAQADSAAASRTEIVTPYDGHVGELEEKLKQYERQNRINREEMTNLSSDLSYAQHQNEVLMADLQTARRRCEELQQRSQTNAHAPYDEEHEL